MSGIASSRQGAVLQLEIDRVAKRNAIDIGMFDVLARELIAANTDDRVRAVLLCGAGDGFTAGHDLQAFSHWPQQPDDPVPRFLHALAALRKPLVIAVHGWAAGIGATALLHADWVIAAPGAILRFPFIDLDISPEAGSSLLLGRLVGQLRARRLLLGGDSITSEQAHDWGLVTELCPGGDLRAAALQRAEKLAGKPPALYARIKDWLAPQEEIHTRIDEEIGLINHAIVARRKNAPQ